MRFQSFRLRSNRSNSRVLKVILVCTLSLFCHCNRSAHPNATPQPAEPIKAKPQTQPPPPELPDCDAAPNKLEASRITGHHRVVLTWNSSTSSSGSNDQSVGYCIYRSRNEQITAKDLSQCKNCKRLNRRPIIGVGCVDDNVEDGSTYDYVAGAIRVGTKVSFFSNKTTAAIARNARSKSLDTPYHLCRPDDSQPLSAMDKPNH